MRRERNRAIMRTQSTATNPLYHSVDTHGKINLDYHPSGSSKSHSGVTKSGGTIAALNEKFNVQSQYLLMNSSLYMIISLQLHTIVFQLD